MYPDQSLIPVIFYIFFTRDKEHKIVRRQKKNKFTIDSRVKP